MERHLAEGLDRIYAQMLEQKRYEGRDTYACQDCRDSGWIDLVDPDGHKSVRRCVSPVHVRSVREPAHIEAIKFQ